MLLYREAKDAIIPVVVAVGSHINNIMHTHL